MSQGEDHHLSMASDMSKNESTENDSFEQDFIENSLPPIPSSSNGQNVRKRKQTGKEIHEHNKKQKLAVQQKENEREEKKMALKQRKQEQASGSRNVSSGNSKNSSQRDEDSEIDAAVYYRSLLSKLVTHKDVVTETFLKDVIESLPVPKTCRQQNLPVFGKTKLANASLSLA